MYTLNHCCLSSFIINEIELNLKMCCRYTAIINIDVLLINHIRRIELVTIGHISFNISIKCQFVHERLKVTVNTVIEKNVYLAKMQPKKSGYF